MLHFQQVNCFSQRLFMCMPYIQAGLISRAVPFEQWEPDMNSDEETEEGGHMQQNLAPLQLSMFTHNNYVVLTSMS